MLTLIINILSLIISIVLAGVAIVNIVRCTVAGSPGESRKHALFVILSMFGLIVTFGIKYLCTIYIYK